MYPLNHKLNPSSREKDRWFGDPRMGVYVARQAVQTLSYLNVHAQKNAFAEDEESEDEDDESNGKDQGAVIQVGPAIAIAMGVGMMGWG